MTGIDIREWLTGRLVADSDLDRPTLARLAADVRAEEALWRDHVRISSDERHYVQLYRDPNVDIWLICWIDGQDTGYHDHDRSQGAVIVCEGAVFEDYFHRDEDGWIREQTNRHETGGAFDFDASYIHGVRFAAGAPAVSIHCYSPALWRMGHYEPDPTGILRRVSMTYADELLAS
jgi:predicted metal-dependent enzyme (double-stranded beta helix superfamily)